MKTLRLFINESFNKKVVKNNMLIDKDIQDKILNGTLDNKSACDILSQYNADYNNYEAEGYDGDIDQLSLDVNFKDFINGELKGSISSDISTQLDILGVDQWYFGLLCICNKNA